VRYSLTAIQRKTRRPSRQQKQWSKNISRLNKTPTTIRLVPVHPVLIRLCFHGYVQSQRNNQQKRLWSNLMQDKFGYWTREFSRWYRLFNREFASEDPKKCFHSFRHTFADRLKQSDDQDVLISELLGHANPNISTGRYGKPYHLDKLLAAVELVDFRITLPVVPNFRERPRQGTKRKRLF
jgi:integrase